MSVEATSAATGGSRPELEEELADQLRSLDDLDAEYRAGDLDEADYRSLRDDYTVRVADTMRRLQDLPPAGGATGARPGRRPRIGPIALVAVTVFAVGAGWLLARSAGERGIGDTLTGDIASNRQRVFECQEMGADGRIVDSLRCFDQVLVDDPDNVEALTYRGWFVVLTTSSAEAAGDGASAAELLEVGLSFLDRAVEVNPRFPDARAFRAVVYDRTGDAEAACAEVAALLELDPPPFFVTQTQGIVDRNGC